MKRRNLLHACLLTCLMLLAGCYAVDRQNETVLSPQIVLANKDAFVNRAISIRGTVTPGLRLLCTLMACSQDNPCCNACAADMQLCAAGSCITVSGDEVGIQVGCSGNECGLTCVPFQQGTVREILGIWRTRASGEYVLELRSASQNSLF